MRRAAPFLLLFALFLGGCAPISNAASMERPTRTPTAVPFTATPTATITPTPTATVAPAPTFTPAPSRTPLPPSTGPFKLVRGFDDQLIPGLLTALTPAGEGRFWLSGPNDAVLLDPNTGEAARLRFTTALLGIDPNGRAWELAENGSYVSAWDGSTWTDYAEGLGWTPASVPDSPLEFKADAGGNTWLLTAADLRRFDGRRWRVFTATEMGVVLPWKAGVSTDLLLALGPETVWVGSCDRDAAGPTGNGSLRRYEDGQWTDAALPALPACISAMAAAPDGSLWVGLYGGTLWRFDAAAQSWSEQRALPLPPSRTSYSDFRELPLDPGGAAWPLIELCTESGCGQQMQRFKVDENGVWERFGPTQQPLQQRLIFAADGLPWLVTPDRVGPLDADGIFTPLQGLTVLAATRDSDGRLWLAAQSDGQVGLWKDSD